MQITATNLRKDLFHAIELARQGEDIIVTHKGQRFRLTPEKQVSKLDRITPMQVFNPDSSEADEERMKAEMQAEWEADWDEQFG